MLETLIAYLEEYGDENLVLLLLGDHPPAPMVSGDKTNRDVPVHLICEGHGNNRRHRQLALAARHAAG